MLFTGPGVVEWVERQLGAHYSELSRGIGWQQNGHFVAGVVYESYNGANIYVHIAKLRGVSLPPTFIAAMMDYPFNQLGLRRITAAIADKNTQSKDFAKRLGAKQEGRMREALPDGGTMVIFGLLRKDAEKWLTEPYRRRLGESNGNWRASSGGSRPRQAASTSSA